MKDRIFDIEVSAMDQYVIDKVREMRVRLGVSQVELAQRMNLSEGAIAKIERPSVSGKYNLRHINLLAKALNCSPKDFFPDKALDGDKIRSKARQIKNPPGKKDQPNYQIIPKKPSR